MRLDEVGERVHAHGVSNVAELGGSVAEVDDLGILKSGL